MNVCTETTMAPLILSKKIYLTIKNKINCAYQVTLIFWQDQTNNLKDRTFRDMFDDTRQAVSRLDDRVGGWIEDRLE